MGQKLVAASEYQIRRGEPDYTFFCPACECDHGIWTSGKNPSSDATWRWNGNMDNPTITPSVRVRHHWKGKNIMCHMIITSGFISYCGDSTHAMAGQTVPMKDIE